MHHGVRVPEQQQAMHPIAPYSIWIGHRGDVHDLRQIYESEIAALVDLALNERPLGVPRDLVYCRFPLLDGIGNARWTLHAAIQTTSGFIRDEIRTLVCCSNGISRSPAIAAAAIALVSGRCPDECLRAFFRD